MKAESLSIGGKKWSREGGAWLIRKECYKNWLWICVLEFAQIDIDKSLHLV